MLKIAKEAILDSGDFLSLDQTAQQLGLLPSDVNKWKAEGQIFSIQHAGCSLVPKYAFHNNAEHKPIPSLKVILDVLRPKKMVGELHSGLRLATRSSEAIGPRRCFVPVPIRCCSLP